MRRVCKLVMRKLSLLSLIFVWAVSAQAQVLMVSDVDDTIKLANVKDLSEASRYAFDDKSRFTGMSDLYALLVKDNPGLKIVYLSKAPNWLMGRTHRQFLQNGKFPQGDYIPRTNYSSEEHKLKTLRELIVAHKPRKVILLGDNGEQDAEIYAQIAKEYSAQGIEFHQFIRIVYASKSLGDWGVPVREGQVGFVTPVEVGLELEKSQFLESSSAEWLVETVGKNILQQKALRSEGDVAFPSFVSCADFEWKWDESLSRFSLLNDLKSRVVARCKVRP